MTRLAILLATFGYVGYFPFAPGTAGSMAALPLYLLLRWLDVPFLEVVVILAVYGAGVWASSVAEREFGRTDPGYVVIDEVVGQLATLALLPVTWQGALLGFLLFRLFDIVKPFPAAQCERLHGGFGIMSDDLVAGVYGNLVLRLVIWLLPGLPLTA